VCSSDLKPEECLFFARECTRQAFASVTDEQREAFLAMARIWNQFALRETDASAQSSFDLE